MAGQAPHSAFVRQLSKGAANQAPPYSLPRNQEVAIGRDPACQIVIDSNQYGMVSRRHVAISPLSGLTSWQVCDLNSANGTYLNGKRLQGCQTLQTGDRIILGKDGPEFLFECQPTYQNTPLNSNTLAPVVNAQQPDSVSFTQLFPIFSTGKDLTRKAFLVPGIITVLFVVAMFATVGPPTRERFIAFALLLAIYLAGAAYYFVYRLCGKSKPWWLLTSSAVMTMVLLLSPVWGLFDLFFRRILPGNVFSLERSGQTSFPTLFIAHFFGAGLAEELFKALPVLTAYLLGRFFNSPRIGVREPLDGILLGSASAVGFTLFETLLQYVPQQVGAAGTLAGVQLLIPRIIGSVAGHMAYSGYFGYFIGLSALKPSKGWQILIIGYLSAATLHALWNSTAIFGLLAPVIVGILSYAFLTAAILKARTLSPTRSQNFATRFLGPP